MADDQKDFSALTANFASEDLWELANAARGRLTTVVAALSTNLQVRLNNLCEVFLSDDNERHHQAIRRMRREGIEASDIIDLIIPELARILGQRWADDDISFVEVTIGTARLQEAVRALVARELSQGVPDTSPPTPVAQTPRVLLVVPRGEDHTLGVFVASDQFRRFGYVVDIAVDQSANQVAETLALRPYALVGLTIAGRRTLASTRELVEIIRANVARVTPIVLGGSLIEFDQDLKTETGVDHVARTVHDALEMCGLDIVELDPPQEMMANC